MIFQQWLEANYKELKHDFDREVDRNSSNHSPESFRKYCLNVFMLSFEGI